MGWSIIVCGKESVWKAIVSVKKIHQFRNFKGGNSAIRKLKTENMNGDQVSYKVTLLLKSQENHEKTEVRRFVVPQDCSTSMVYLKEKLRYIIYIFVIHTYVIDNM